MGERKVLNKYYPPDFDPAKIPRRRQPKNQQIKVRMMLPMSIRCERCGTYIYKGTKFNSRKEDVADEKYLGIQIFRFYFKCTKCSSEITMKTDPQNSDYVVESGAARNFEPWREEDEVTGKEKRKRDAEEMGDAMKTLENKALDSKQEMDKLTALEETRSIKSRHATVSVELMLEALQRSSEEKEKKTIEEDEALIKSIVFHNSKDFIQRLDDDEDEDLEEDLCQPSSNLSGPSDYNIKRNKVENPTDALTKASIFNNFKNGETVGVSLAPNLKFIVKSRSDLVAKKPGLIATKKGQPRDDEECGNLETKATEMTTGLLSLCQSYGSDDE